MKRARAAATLAAASMLLAMPVDAQEAAPSASGDGIHPPQDFRRVRELVAEGRFAEARAELERLYQLAPTYRLLNNVAYCEEQLGNYIEAVRQWRKYLELGGEEIPVQRRDEVRATLQRLEPRIARLTIRTNVTGANVIVDDRCPIGAETWTEQCAIEDASLTILVNPGRHRITLRKEAHLPESTTVSVAGSDVLEMAVNFGTVCGCYGCERGPNPFVVPAYVSWGTTLAGGIATGIAGYVSTEDGGPPSAATYGLMIGTGVAALVATYFTVRGVHWNNRHGARLGPAVTF